MTNADRWRERIICKLNELDAAELDEVIDRLIDLLDVTGVCAQCGKSIDVCPTYLDRECPFLTVHGITDYMQAEESEWDFAEYVSRYLD